MISRKQPAWSDLYCGFKISLKEFKNRRTFVTKLRCFKSTKIKPINLLKNHFEVIDDCKSKCEILRRETYVNPFNY